MNCQRNEPWYRDWQTAFAEKEVQLLGIHTPETQAERRLDALTTHLAAAELDFPVLVDNTRQNWKLWGNRVWPSVYVVDQQGYLRDWWFGELNWRGAGVQKVIKQRVFDLLTAQEQNSPTNAD